MTATERRDAARRELERLICEELEARERRTDSVGLRHAVDAARSAYVKACWAIVQESKNGRIHL